MGAKIMKQLTALKREINLFQLVFSLPKLVF